MANEKFFTVSITYTASNDIFNAKVQKSNIVTAAAIPGITANEMPGEYVGPSKAYLYAADSATLPQYLKEKLGTITAHAATTEEPVTPAYNEYTDADVSYLTSSQLRWPKSVTNSIINILEAYRTPQIPVFRAWQTFKLAIAGGSMQFVTDSAAEAQFYVEAGKALANYGFEVTATPSN